MIGLQWQGLLLICKPRLRPKSLAALFPPFSPPSITHRQHLANICPQLGPRNQQHGVGSAVGHHRLLQPLRQHANVPRHRLLTAHRLKRPSWTTRCPKIRLRTKRTKKRTGTYYYIWLRIANGPDKQIGLFHNEFLIKLALVFFSKLNVPRLLFLYYYIACK